MRHLLLKLLRRRRLERDLEAELAFHRQMSDSSQNPISLGNTASIKEQALDLWRFPLVENLWRDLIYAARGLRRSPALLICALFSLGLGIGANTAIFQLLDAIRLRTLPVYKPQELAAVRIVGGHGGMGINPGKYPELTRPVWEELRHHQEAFSGLFAWRTDRVNIGEGDHLRNVNAMWVSGDFFHVLGIRPWTGQLLSSEDEGPCPGSTVVVSYAYWTSALGAAPIHTLPALVIDSERRQIIGVAPPQFTGLSVGDRSDIMLPLCHPSELRDDIFDIAVMGRLRPGWTLQRASQQLQSVSPGIFLATVPSGRSSQSIERYKRFRLAAYPASSGVSLLRTQYDSSLWLLLGITGLVLLIACANLANLLLARASTRDREMAVRVALGASRTRLLEQLFAEGVLLAGVGALLGLALAQVFSRLLIWALSTEENSVILPLTTDWRVLLFTAFISSLTCVVFAVVPARRAVNAEPASAMKAAARGMTGSHERSYVQHFLVVLQIAVSLTLLIGALLFVQSFRNLITFNPGMREADITVAFFAFQRSHIAHSHYKDFQRQLLQDVHSIPGVTSVASTTNVPLLGGSWGHDVRIGSIQGSSKFTWVSPGYFNTMGIRLIGGRDFSDNDTSDSEHVALVNETFVHRYLGNTNPFGQTLRTEPERGYPSTLYRIVGVIADTKYNNIRTETPPMTFAPASQFPDAAPFTALLIYSKLPESQVLSAVKHTIARKHPGVVITGGDFQKWIRDGMVGERLMAMLAGLFGLMAALLAMVGLYGVMAYLIASRRPEIGIRMALGAQRTQIIGMIMQEAGNLLFIGILFGTALSLVVGRGATSLLFDLKPYDPLTLVIAVLMLTVVSGLASFLPAHRASNLDPTIALRYE